MLRLLVLSVCTLACFAQAQNPTPPVFENSDFGFEPYNELIQYIDDIAGYSVEIWGHSGDDFSPGMAFRLVNTDGTIEAEHESWIINIPDQLLATDLNNNGLSDLVVEAFSGGAHCCSKTWLYELDTQPILSFESAYSECPATFQDLDEDGVMEITSCDDTWAYRYCSYAESPLPAVAWRWSGNAYVLESQAFPQLYARETAWALTNFLSLQANEVEWTLTPECSALALTLPFLYRGEPKLAYEALNLSYSPNEIYDDSVTAAFDSVDAFWQDILSAYNASYLSSPFRTELP